MTESVDFDNPKNTFVIAEAGSNWKCGSYEDDLKQAKKLIKVASTSGCDAVKFQTFRSKSVYVSNAGNSDYLTKHGNNKNINEIFTNLEMSYEMLPELSKICKQEKIILMSTPFSVEDAKHIDDFVSIHKVASYELNHIRLLEYLSNTNKPILISTGASTYKQIDFTVDLFRKKNDIKIGLMQCTAKYPCPMNALNLQVIPKMITKYELPIGFSDHSLHPIIAPLVAIGLGATFVEKHFTLDKNLFGPDHMFALNPVELKLMVDSIRNADKAKGTGIKEILNDEKELWKFATRSIQAIKNISKGEILKEGYNIDILRPGNQSKGLEPMFIDKINGKKATKNYLIGEGIINSE